MPGLIAVAMVCINNDRLCPTHIDASAHSANRILVVESPFVWMRMNVLILDARREKRFTFQRCHTGRRLTSLSLSCRSSAGAHQDCTALRDGVKEHSDKGTRSRYTSAW